MDDHITCPNCGALNQEVGKFCEQCGSRIEPAAPPAPDGATTPDTTPADDLVAPPDAPDGDAPDDGSAPAAGPPGTDAATVPDGSAVPHFVRILNGRQIVEQRFDVPGGATLLVGRADRMNGIFPEVDVTPWARRVSTPDGELYTIHRRQCFISHGDDGRIRIVDCPEYVGDTLVAIGPGGHFRPIPALADEREANDEGAVVLEAGDRIMMGEGEGTLIFELVA